MIISLDKFVEEVRCELCSLGLPLNGGWQPSRADLQVFYARGFSIRETALKYKSNVKRYEDFVNKEKA